MYDVALNILNILMQNGFDAYIIGGYVRDKLLGKDSNDIDITTTATPSDLKNIFNEFIIDEGNYGSVKLKYMTYIFDVTTFRKDIGTINNRKPEKVEYVDTLAEDILRRDFTINTICIDHNGNYLDILDGISDIKNGIIRTVSNPAKKIKEDAFRILRAIRFACILDFMIDKSLFNSIRNYGHLLNNISFYRKKSELDAIFSAQNALYGIKLIIDLGLDKILKINGLNNVKYTKNYLGIWAQLDYPDNYNFTKKENSIINEIRKIIKYNNIDVYILYRYKLSNVFIAGEILNITSDKIINIYKSMQIHSRKEIKLSISDINKLPPSKINDIYIDLEHEILYNNLKNDKEEILNYINNKYMEGLYE